jgi:hypothetical protein
VQSGWVRAFDQVIIKEYTSTMNAVEFTIELTDSGILRIPSEVAAQLPKAGKARIIVLTDDEAEDTEWRQGAYAQFLREESPDDGIYDSLR